MENDQIDVLKKCFDGFADEDGAIPAEEVGNILAMMGLKGIKPAALKDIIEEIDEDGSGLLEFGEFCQLGKVTGSKRIEKEWYRFSGGADIKKLDTDIVG